MILGEDAFCILGTTGLDVSGREMTTHSLIRGGPSRLGPSGGGVPGYVHFHIQYTLCRDGCSTTLYRGLSKLQRGLRGVRSKMISWFPFSQVTANSCWI